MSSISSIGQASFQFVRNTTGASPAGPPTDVASTHETPDARIDADAGRVAQQGVERPHRHHHGGGGRFKEIESAVTDALQQAKSSGDGSADLNQVVQTAIAKALGSHVSGGAKGGDGPPPPPTDGQGPKPSGESDPSAFLQTLQQYGIDPAQFRDDFRAALHAVKGESADASQAAPPGTLVDVNA